MADNYNQRPAETGFALLVALIVVSVVVSVGLVILDLTTKQVLLSTNNKASESAFHAANAGMECARYWRRERTSDFVAGNNLSGITCFGTAASNLNRQSVDLVANSGGREAWHYRYDFTWNGDRCSRVDTVVVVAPVLAGDAVVEAAEINTHVPGYPSSAGDVTCPAGSACTVMAVRGYNQACPSSGGSFGYGVVERKVLLEF